MTSRIFKPKLEFGISSLGSSYFSTSFLPDLTEQALSYYFENYQPNDAPANYLFHTLAYSFAKAASYLLIGTFIYILFSELWG